MTDPRRSPPRVGTLLREWRLRRRYSQLALACDAGISARHLSFVESGRARPSRDMLLHLAERLDVPLRERNALLLSAGFAPVYTETPLTGADSTMLAEAVSMVLAGHEPFPALAVDRHWQLVAANRAVAPLLAGAAEALLRPPVNVLRLSLHPEGLAPRIVNLPLWRAHILARLGHQVARTHDDTLAALLEELKRYPAGDAQAEQVATVPQEAAVVLPFQIRTAAGVLSFIGTTMVFGTPLDVTASEIAIESFLPADAATAAALRAAVNVPA